MRRLLGLAALIGALVLVPQAAHAADYGAPGQVSAVGNQEFNAASAPAYAAGGAFVAFRGSLGGQPGIYRRDQRTGAVALVATGDASGPSISADGRYVAFTSTANLDPADDLAVDGGCPQVFVRDMTLALGAPGATTLASARDGASAGLTYAGCPGIYPNPPKDGSAAFPITGAQAAAGSAISADGRSVVFTVLGPSDLGQPVGSTQTDASQVAVRNLDTRTTTVVSVGPDGRPTPGGGAYPSKVSETTTGAKAGSITENAAIGSAPSLPLSTASISADGTTVAWLGTNVPGQVPSATDVAPGMARQGRGGVAQEVEPLWRRVADGPGAMTKRLMAGAGLDFYDALRYPDPLDAIEAGTLAGPVLAAPHGPVLSADGTSAALLSDALTPQDEAAVQAATASSSGKVIFDDAYLVRVSDGPSAPQVTRLTHISYFDPAQDSAIADIAISPSGRLVAFETTRTQFPASALTLITPPSVGSSLPQTYVADLARGTVELTSSTFDGSAPNGGSMALSLDAAGDVAVSSQATNLIYGDQNSGQVFAYPYLALPTAVAGGAISPLSGVAAPRPALAPWTIGVRALSRRNGDAAVQITVPGGGRLRARATAQLPARARTDRSRALSAGAEAHASPPTTTKRKPTKRKKRKKKVDKGVPVPSRTVATATRRVGGARSVTVTLRAARRYRSLVRSRHGLYAVVTVRFTSAGHAALVEQVPVTFRRARPKVRRHHHHPTRPRVR